MSGISSGIGLISGINTAELIDQLMALERRPIETLQQRAASIDARRTALLGLSAQLLAIRNAVTNFDKPSFFNRFGAKSSNEGVVTARTNDGAIPTTTSLRVHSLVSNHALITRGFADADTTPIGGGVLTFESAQGRVNRSTELSELNGGAGVRRGTIRITDGNGNQALIDLRTAVTVDDVLEAINSHPDINVRARITGSAFEDMQGNTHTGDRIVLEDLTGASGPLTVVDANGGFAAADMGIAGSTSSGRLDGSDIMRLGPDSPLSLLNDGNGVGRLARGDDLNFETSFGSFQVSLGNILEPETDLRQLNNGRGVRLGTIRVTDRAGHSVDIDLSSLANQGRITVQDVREKIVAEAQAAGVSVSVTMVNSSFLVSDSSTPADEDARLIIEDVDGFAAADLGIAVDEEDGGFVGRAVYRIQTVGDVVRAINYAEGNDAQVQASISPDGNGIRLEAFGLDNAVTVRAGSTDDGVVSTAARDLGIEDAAFSTNQGFSTRRLVAGLNTVLLQTLRGGNGVSPGSITITDAAGHSVDLDLTDAQTLQDVIDRINNHGETGVRARINAAGNGIEIYDESGGTGSIEIRDLTGSLAEELGIAGVFQAADGASINGGNLQRQYITRNTSLASLNAGRGVSLGAIRITDSNENVFVVELAQNLKTVGQVIDAINQGTPDTIIARINDNGDGIVVSDATTGAARLRISDNSGHAAGDLRLAGTAAAGASEINGSFETRIEIGAGDTLTDIAAKINASNAEASAGVLNSGASLNPFSLTITSENTGRRGEILLDTGSLDFGLRTLSRAQDAVVTVGDGNGPGAVVITSATNQLSNVVAGVTFDLLGVSDEAVTVTVDQDVDAIVAGIQSFVDAYNGAIDSIAQSTSFNQETFERGPLFGDSTVNIVQSRLRNTLLRSFSASGPSVSRLFNVGLRLSSGGRLEFDDQQFRETYARSPDSVESLFTTAETGFGDVIQETLEGLTQDFDGVLARRDQLLLDQQELISDRVDGLNVLLEAKRARLQAQFAALESALAGLQAQQDSLAGLAQLAAQSNA